MKFSFHSASHGCVKLARVRFDYAQVVAALFSRNAAIGIGFGPKGGAEPISLAAGFGRRWPHVSIGYSSFRFGIGEYPTHVLGDAHLFGLLWRSESSGT